MKRRDLIIGAGTALATSALIRPASPFVITKRWTRWPYHHGFRQFQRKVPEGLHISPYEDWVKYRDPENDRLYNIQPLHPDVRDWSDANADRLRARLQRRSSANIPGEGNVALVETPEFNGISFFLFQSFMGISAVASTPGAAVSFWIGLTGTHRGGTRSVTGSGPLHGGTVSNVAGLGWLMQPVMFYDGSELTTNWNLQNECFVGNSSGGQVADFVDGNVSITAGTAYWARVSYSRANGGFWEIQWFTGTNKRVGGLVPGLSGLRISPDANGEQIADFDLAQCEMELKGAATCDQISFQGVFGGLRLTRGGLSQVSWQGGPGDAASCGQNVVISNRTLNPNCQITITG